MYTSFSKYWINYLDTRIRDWNHSTKRLSQNTSSKQNRPNLHFTNNIFLVLIFCVLNSSSTVYQLNSYFSFRHSRISNYSPLSVLNQGLEFLPEQLNNNTFKLSSENGINFLSKIGHTVSFRIIFGTEQFKFRFDLVTMDLTSVNVHFLMMCFTQSGKYFKSLPNQEIITEL